MKQWEYKKVFKPNEYALEDLGKEGWELVATVGNFDTDFYFKRPLD